MHERHGELLPNGYHVGDLVTYSSGSRTRYGHVLPHQGGPDRVSSQIWSHWADTEERAAEEYARGVDSGTWVGTNQHPHRLIRNYEGSTMMTAEAATQGSPASAAGTQETTTGTWVPATGPIADGQRFRYYWTSRGHVVGGDRFAYQGTMVAWSQPGDFTDRQRRVILETGGEYNADGRHTGAETTLDSSSPSDMYAVWQETTVPVSPENIAYDGTVGAFAAHDGAMPEPGTIVRGMVQSTNKQVEGLFLRLTPGETTATVECKRRRTKRADGTFGEWQSYANATRRQVTVEGAEVFKPGAAAAPVLMRGTPITNASTSALVNVGDVLSAKEKYGEERIVFRGVVVRKYNDHGEWIINATEKARLSDRRQATGVYDWKPIEPRQIHALAQWTDGTEGNDRAGYVWTKTAPGTKPIDPAFDPKRKTPHTGMGIGDLVVGLRKENDYGRDTVSSWVTGEIIKWDVRYWRPIVKVTNPMESGVEVGKEVALVSEDTYPALPDPKVADPEEFKKTLRLYLIGRHKRGDFCRGGLNTMLAAHGIPLYETRRRAIMQVTVDYDPNTTDMYALQTELRRGLTGVSGLSFSERSGEDIELTLESDRTGD